jgi:DNA-binding CsgD family transcriptional regulator
MGRGYPMDVGVPYALFAEAVVPLVRTQAPESLAALTRGADAELSHLLPFLGRDRVEGPSPVEEPGDSKARLLWSSWLFLEKLASRQPLVVILDDLHWADSSSLDLLHFILRQIGESPIAVMCAYNSGLRDQNPRMRSVEQSLVAGGLVTRHVVGPFTIGESTELVRTALGSRAALGEVASVLHERTRGNPLFLEEILKALGAPAGGGTEVAVTAEAVRDLQLPPTVREIILFRLADLSVPARELADLLCVFGTNVCHDALRSAAAIDELDLVERLEELRRARILEERVTEDALSYGFAHPLIRETLYGDLGRARSRILHGRIAQVLDRHYGQSADHHADELAYHFARGRTSELSGKAAHYLALAGRGALAKHANREAASYLGGALEAAREAGLPMEPVVVEDLARARQRLGEYEVALGLWEQLRSDAIASGDELRAAEIDRRIGTVYFWSGRHHEACEVLERGGAMAGAAGDDALLAHIRLAEGECLLELGRSAEARQRVQEALQIAERIEDASLLAAVNLALLYLHTWIGPPAAARRHGERLLALTAGGENRQIHFSAHLGLGVLAGLTGELPLAHRHIAACTELAEQLDSPILRLRLAELTVDVSVNSGDWDVAVAVAERAISDARALNERAILPRLLVSTALIHFGRAEMERGTRYVDEAWELVELGRPVGPVGIKTIVAAYVGRAAHAIASGDFHEAIRFGHAGLAITDGTGYTLWSIHRLLPMVAEAYLIVGDLDSASRIGARLRRDSERLCHELGIAWADACDALLVWLRGDIASGAQRMRTAAEHLEAIPALPDAARLRRHLAARLRDHGDHAEAIRELRHIHEIFVRLGAERELAKTREQIRELGARPPARVPAEGGLGGLTAREREIARQVADRKSNKAIAKSLDISARTVSTHLANIFRKLEVGSRQELADLVRDSSSRIALPGR